MRLLILEELADLEGIREPIPDSSEVLDRVLQLTPLPLVMVPLMVDMDLENQNLTGRQTLPLWSVEVKNN